MDEIKPALTGFQLIGVPIDPHSLLRVGSSKPEIGSSFNLKGVSCMPVKIDFVKSPIILADKSSFKQWIQLGSSLLHTVNLINTSTKALRLGFNESKKEDKENYQLRHTRLSFNRRASLLKFVHP